MSVILRNKYGAIAVNKGVIERMIIEDMLGMGDFLVLSDKKGRPIKEKPSPFIDPDYYDAVDVSDKKGEVKVNGTLLSEDYISEATTRDSKAFTYPITIPDGYAFVLGDNRNVSKDSRHPEVGLVPADEIVGKVLLRFFPFDNFGMVE